MNEWMNEWINECMNEWKNEPVQLRHSRQWQPEVKHVTSWLRTLPTFLKNWHRIKLFLWKLISRISNVVFVLGTCIAHFNVRNLIAIRYMYNYCIYVGIYSMINKRNLKKSIYFINNSVHHVYIRHVGVDIFILLYVLYYVTQWLERLLDHPLQLPTLKTRTIFTLTILYISPDCHAICSFYINPHE